MNLAAVKFPANHNNLLARLDKSGQLGPLQVVVVLLPVGPMLVVVLGRVQVRVHPESPHLAEQIQALGVGPGLVVEALQSAAELGAGAAQGLRRARDGGALLRAGKFLRPAAAAAASTSGKHPGMNDEKNLD